MAASVKLSPLNSLIFVSDENGGAPPIPVRGAQILATPTCVSVACYPEQDGQTLVTLGTIAELPNSHFYAFDGYLLTPNRVVVVSTVTNDVVLRTEVRRLRAVAHLYE